MATVTLGTTYEIEDLGAGQFRHTQYTRPIAYNDGGVYRRIVNDYLNDGGGYIVSTAPLMVTIGDDTNGRATRRLHPTREIDVWAEIGRPYNVSTRLPYALNPFTRSGNLLTSTNTLANVYVWHGGHYSKLGIQLRGTWRTNPPAQFAFPVGLQGLTWDNGTLRKNGIAVMHLSAPVVYDLDNELDRRPIAWEFTQLAGQWYVVFTLPNLSSNPMSRPLVDPTLTLQPDATAGLDTMIQQVGPNTNFGTFDSLIVGKRTGVAGPERALIEFDLSGLPDAAVISSTTFSLYRTTGEPSSVTIEVFRVKRAWVESQATWNIYSTGNSWQTAGCSGANDVESSAIGSLSVPATNGFKDWALTPTTKAALDLGNGWLCKATDEATNLGQWFASSDNATSANRPKLVIVYTEGGAARHMMYYKRQRG